MSKLCVPKGSTTTGFNPLAFDWPENLPCPGSTVEAGPQAGLGPGSGHDIGPTPIQPPAQLPNDSAALPDIAKGFTGFLPGADTWKGLGLGIVGILTLLVGVVIWLGVGSNK